MQYGEGGLEGFAAASGSRKGFVSRACKMLVGHCRIHEHVLSRGSPAKNPCRNPLHYGADALVAARRRICPLPQSI